MSKKNNLKLMQTIFFTIILCNITLPAEQIEQNTEKKYAIDDLIKANNTFVFNLYTKINKSQENLFFSPYSISTALAMTFAGARGNTEKQVAKVMHFHNNQKEFHPIYSDLTKHLNSLSEKGNVQLNIANSLWLQKGYKIKNEFLTITKDNYNSGLNQINFKKTEKTRKLINAWVAENTNNKIKELLKIGILEPLTKLVLANAIYFKGDWKDCFKESSTKEQPFFISKKDSVMVPLMHKEAKYTYYSDSLCKVLKMPYKGNELSMIFLLPLKKHGLSELEENLTNENIYEWLNRGRRTKVIVDIPKFTITSEFELGKTLATMGMPEAFSNKANFTGITNKKDLKLSEVVHKAYIKVDEKGSEAAAATASGMLMMAMPESEPEFRADHPFLFIIRDNHYGTILFIGRVMNPSV